jgi:uncharacterized Zn finger protein (UPF0148 family)
MTNNCRNCGVLLFEKNILCPNCIQGLSEKEKKEKRENELLKKQLKKAIAQRDTSDEYGANMQERSNKAVRDRDDSNYAMKVAIAEKEKFKRRLNAIESLMGKERPANKVDIRPEETIGFSVLTILTVVLLGFK